MGIAWLLILVFGWETVYHRNPIYDTDTASQDVSDTSVNKQICTDKWQNVGSIKSLQPSEVKALDLGADTDGG